MKKKKKIMYIEKLQQQSDNTSLVNILENFHQIYNTNP